MASTEIETQDANMRDAIESVRVELHQRIAVHEQETVLLKAQGADAQLKFEKLISDYEALLRKSEQQKTKIKELDEKK